jgi:hypothetical protein
MARFPVFAPGKRLGSIKPTVMSDLQDDPPPDLDKLARTIRNRPSEPQLILRPGRDRADDYDVLHEGRIIGRIYKTASSMQPQWL